MRQGMARVPSQIETTLLAVLHAPKDGWMALSIRNGDRGRLHSCLIMEYFTSQPL